MSVAVFQHVEVERLGRLGDALERCGVEHRCFPFHRGAPVPAALDALGDALVVLGGPMGVYEEASHPWLAAEIRIIGEALREDFPVYGLCLGCQLMARALGARVYPGEGKKEIGWFPIRLTEEAAGDPLHAAEPDTFPVFQWHGDTFDLPAGAVRLASSERYPNQAFRFGRRGYAFQYHLEVGAGDIRTWLDVFGEDAASPRSDADPEAILRAMPDRLEALNARSERLFLRWLALAGLAPGAGEGQAPQAEEGQAPGADSGGGAP
ncbi:MAG: glutamine amidotransferase [bacterium]